MKSIFEEMGGTYRQEGDCLLPNPEPPQQSEPVPPGKYGRLRLHFLKEQRRALYGDLMLSGKLHKHLREIDERTSKQVDEIVTTMERSDGTDARLKSRDQLRWVGLMNNYLACAEETVLKDVVYGRNNFANFYNIYVNIVYLNV